MKMKFTLLAAAVAMTGIGASAQTFSKLVDSYDPSRYEDLTKIITPSNATSVSDANTKKGKLPGVQIIGSVDGKNVLVANETFQNQTWGVLGPDGETIGAFYNEKDEAGAMKYDYMRFRYNAGNKGRGGESRQINAVRKEVPNEYKTAYVEFVVGPKPAGATSDVLIPTLELVSAKDADNGNARYAMTFAFPEVTLTDETQTVAFDMTGVSGDWFAEDGSVKNFKVNYVDFYVRGLSEGQFVALKQFGFANILPTPKVGFNTVTTRDQAFWGQSDETLPGTIYIQAEDFDGVGTDGEPTFSPVCTSIDIQWKDGYGYTTMPRFGSHWSKGDMSNVRIDPVGGKNPYGWGTGQQRAGEDGLSSTNGGFGLIGMCKMDGEWGTNYGGEYLNDTDNKISLEQAMDGFGSWFEYTFEMEEDGYVDISIGACSHHGSWLHQVLAGGAKRNGAVLGEGYENGAYVTKYKKPREEGGYEVEGLDDDFLKLYGFCYVLSFDGVDQRTNWDIRPIANAMTGAITDEAWVNPLSWKNNQEIDENGNTVNSKFLFIMPSAPVGADHLWWPNYKDVFMNHWYNDGPSEGVNTDFHNQCDELGADYFETTFKNRPDYKDIPCSAGKHTIRVKSMGGSTIFDEIRIRAKKEPSVSGIESIAAKRVAEEFAGEPEYFDLQGRRVAAPTKGIFIVKRGSNVTKEVIR